MHIALQRFFFPRLRAASRETEVIGWTAFAGMILAGSTYSSFAKELTDVLSPLSLVIISEILTLAFAFFSFGFIPVIRDIARLPRNQLLPIALIGLLSGTVAPLFLFEGLALTGAVNATLFGNTEMLFLLLLAAVFLGERLHPAHFISLASIAFGIVFIAFRGFTETMSLQAGDLFLILASATFSVGSLIFRRSLHAVAPQTIIVSRSIIAIAGLSAVSLVLPVSPLHEISAFPLHLVAVLLGFAIISRFTNIFCFYEALDRLPVSSISLFSNISVFTAILFAHVYLGEAVYGYQVAGGFFIILGTILLEVVGRHHPSTAHQEAHMEQSQTQRV